MHPENVERVLALLRPDDLVLDIGGWARPFNRADYVLDMEPYETRGFYGRLAPAQGGGEERFRRETWIQRDLCERTPYPFADKAVDFVICSHTLEDVRDPLWVCSEMVRIARRGYIEVPSREAESCRGTEPGQVGWSHHRWLIDIGGNHLSFLMKLHMIHSHWRFSLPASHLRRMPPERQVQWLFWEDSFTFSERFLHGLGAMADELASYAQSRHPRPRWLLATDRALRRTGRLGNRVVNRLRRGIAAGRG